MPGIRDWVSETATGEPMPPVDLDQLGKWLRDAYVNNEAERARRESFGKRHDFYMCGGVEEMKRIVSSTFRSPDVISRRLPWTEIANFNSPLRRVVNEKSTVYQQPARRSVKDAAANKTYQDLQRACRQHDAFRRINRWLNLHNNLVIGFRVRRETDGRLTPVIDIVTPDCFFAVAHPADPTKLIALILDLKPKGPFVTPDSAHYLVWTDHERFFLNKTGYIMAETWKEHGLPRMPWLLLSTEPASGRLLDATTGNDLVAATEACWFQHILLLKESKSATKLPIVQGDVTAAARAQAAESELPLEIPEGVTVNAIDLSMDLSMFRDNARYVYETSAANHAVAPSLLHHQGTQSADARELQRVPLRELRLDQQIYLREVERDFVGVQLMVCEREAPEFVFDADGWRLDFADPQTPLSQKESQEVFEQGRRLGLTDTLEEIRRRNPDLDDDQALDELMRHIDVETTRVVAMKELIALSGSMGAEQPDGKSGATERAEPAQQEKAA